MSVLDSLEEIREQALAELKSRKSLEELDQLRVSVFGKNGNLTSILRTMGKMDPQERAAVGKEANRVKQALESALSERREILLRAAQQAKFELERVDVTAPGRHTLPTGRIHPMTQTYREIRDALVGMGFSLFGGPEIELDENNFTLLNLPPDHPARDMQDTFYINENVVLRTHTSPCEIRALKSVKPPFRLIMPGRVFRVDEVDASHSPVFMQIEGFIVDKGLTLGDLKGTLDTFVRAVFGDEVRTRLRPSYFPIHGTLGGDGHELHDLRRKRLPRLQGNRLDRDPRLRHHQPARTGKLRTGSEGMDRARVRRRRGPCGEPEIRHLGYPARV